MSGDEDDADASTVAGRLRAVVRGTNDTRVRATWRVLLAWPVLWFVTGTIAVVVGSGIVPAGATKPLHMAAFGLLQGAFFAAGWVAWARYLDRRPLRNYGLSPSRSWLLDLLAGFGAVLVGTAVWLGVGSSLGWASVEISLTTPGGSLVLGLAGMFVGVLVNVWDPRIATTRGAGSATRGRSRRTPSPARARR